MVSERTKEEELILRLYQSRKGVIKLSNIHHYLKIPGIHSLVYLIQYHLFNLNYFSARGRKKKSYGQRRLNDRNRRFLKNRRSEGKTQRIHKGRRRAQRKKFLWKGVSVAEFCNEKFITLFIQISSCHIKILKGFFLLTAGYPRGIKPYHQLYSIFQAFFHAIPKVQATYSALIFSLLFLILANTLPGDILAYLPKIFDRNPHYHNCVLFASL